jgi:hypothetical protein
LGRDDVIGPTCAGLLQARLTHLRLHGMKEVEFPRQRFAVDFWEARPAFQGCRGALCLASSCVAGLRDNDIEILLLPQPVHRLDREAAFCRLAHLGRAPTQGIDLHQAPWR